jgi:hypothetical protein
MSKEHSSFVYDQEYLDSPAQRAILSNISGYCSLTRIFKAAHKPTDIHQALLSDQDQL